VVFDPVAFHRIARNWYQGKTDTGEAAMRSVVSRAYYAAFLWARKAANLGQASHMETALFYTASPASAIKIRIGNRLNVLRDKRELADYDLAILCVSTTAQDALELSKLILLDLAVPAVSLTTPPPIG
jgi:hypothetical protein